MLLETSILIDILRKDPAAREWIENLPDDAALAVPGISMMELIRGQMLYDAGKASRGGSRTRVHHATEIPQSRQGIQQIVATFRDFPKYWPTEAAQEKALRRMAELYPAENVSIEDHLIAFTAISANLPLATRDSDYRHFTGDGLRLVTVYAGKSESSSRQERSFEE